MKEFENEYNGIGETPLSPDPKEEKAPEQTPAEEAPSAEAPIENTPITEAPREDKEPQYTYTPPYQPPYHEPQKPKKSNSGTATFLVCFCLILSIFVGFSAGALFGGANKDEAETTTANAEETTETTSGSTDNASTAETTTTETTTAETAPGVTVVPSAEQIAFSYRNVVEKCIKSVVAINVTESSVSYGQEYEVAGAGSGVIYTKDGYIITNYHVANDNTKSITVTLYDGTKYEGKYIYGDQYVDLAVIKIEKDDCDYASFGNYDDVHIGDMVLAIGNPLGYGITVTDGIVSALDKAITIENTTMVLLQTSAEINSGNSGGGLFNMNGELIGIVNAKIAGTSVEGMGYAIPSSVVVKSINDLKDFGYITGKARLGVTVQTKQYQTWPYMQTHTYTQVTEINPNGSAAKSGLQVGDILYRFNDTEITSFEVLSQQLTKYKVGDTVKLTVRRPTIELTANNLSEYLTTSETVELEITFVEFNPSAK